MVILVVILSQLLFLAGEILWFDLEFTGLDIQTDCMTEVGGIVTE